MAEAGKIPDEEVVNNKDQEGGDLQKDATCPSHLLLKRDHDGSSTEENAKRRKTDVSPSQHDQPPNAKRQKTDGSSDHITVDYVAEEFKIFSSGGADPSPTDGYNQMFTQMSRGEQEEGVRESESTTPSMKPVVDTGLPSSTTHNSKMVKQLSGAKKRKLKEQRDALNQSQAGNIKKYMAPFLISPQASKISDPTLEVRCCQPGGISRADPSPADGYTRMFTRKLRGEQEEGVSESESTTPSMKPVVDTGLPSSTTHNSKSLRIADQLSNGEPTKSVVGSSSSKTIERKKKRVSIASHHGRKRVIEDMQLLNT